MSTLLIDAGNSRIKWALLVQGQWGPQGVCSHAEVSVMFSALTGPARVIISNVAGPAIAQQLSAACHIRQLLPEWVSARQQQCGVQNRYEHPEQLGSDRWSALIGAWHIERRACLVVNCGTATTIDALSGRGEFLGGLILPGVEMMQHSLRQGTAQLDRIDGKVQDFPRNTADAIVAGAVAATSGAILRQYALLGYQAAPCLLSGGAAEWVAGQLDELPLVQIENLVLHGMQHIAEEA